MSEAGDGEGGPEPAKEREARAPGKSQGRKGGGQRKQDLAVAPSSPTRKQRLRQPLTPHENLCQDKEGEGHSPQQLDDSCNGWGQGEWKQGNNSSWSLGELWQDLSS